MSHYVNTELKLSNQGYIVEALKQMGHQIKQGRHSMPNGYGQVETVDFAIVGKPIGFRKKGDSYEMVADFWGTGLNRVEFVRRLKREYAKIQVAEVCKKTGLRPSNWVETSDGKLQMLAVRNSWG